MAIFYELQNKDAVPEVLHKINPVSFETGSILISVL